MKVKTALAVGALAAVLGPVNAIAQTSFSWAAGDDLSGWNGYINAFDIDCTTYRGYGYGYTINPDGGIDGNVVNLTADGYMNVFSNYGDGNQPNICLETNVYREVVITAGDEGDYRMNFEPIVPAPADTGATTKAFIKVLNFGDYSDTGLSAYVDTPANGTVATTISAADLAGGDLRVQFGFLTVAAGYDPSGMFYDNIAFAEGLAAPAPPGPPVVTPGDPTAVPALPTYGLMLLAVLAGWLGQRQLRNRR